MLSLLSWKETLLDGYKNGHTLSESLQDALMVMLRHLYKILPLTFQKKGFFNRSVQSGVVSQILSDCICKILLESSESDEKLADYVGKLMIEMRMIEFDGQDINTMQLSQDKKKIIRFLHPYLPRLVIVGGGHSGFMSAIQLHEYFSIVLIDRNDYCSLKPGYPTVLEDINQSKNISLKYSEALPSNVTFIHGFAKLVREDGVFIELSDESQVKNLFSVNTETLDDIKSCKYLTFDFLVLSTGCNAWRNIPTYDGNSGDNKIFHVDSYNMDMVKDAVNIIHQSDDSKSVVVIGGGVVGSEFFGSLTHTFPKKRIYLVQRSDILMKPSQDAHKVATEIFGKMKNANIMLNSQVDRQSDPETLIVKSSETGEETSIKCCTCFLASGNSPNTNMMKDYFPSSLDESGYLKVNSSFQLFKSNSEYYNNIFVLGDISNIDSQKLMQNANFHYQKFVEIAKAVVQLQTKDLPTYESGVRVMAISLGPKHGFVMKDNKVLFKSGIVNKLKYVLQSTTMTAYNKHSKK